MGALLLDEDDYGWDYEVIKPQPGPQTFLMRCNVPQIVYGGARGGAKTYGLILKWIMHHQLYGHIHPRAARGIIFRREVVQLDDFISQANNILPELGWNWRAGKRKFENPETGSELLMRHMENEEDAKKYQGHSYSFVGIDELGDFSPQNEEGSSRQILGQAVRMIMATLRSPYGVPTQFIATANPGGRCHTAIRNEFIDPDKYGYLPFPDPVTGLARIFIPSRLEDNQILMQGDPDYEKRLQGTGPDWLVRAWRHGDWSVSPEGNAFKRAHFQWINAPLQWHQYKKVAISWDTAYKTKKENDRSAVTVWGDTGNSFHLLYAWAGRVEFPDLKRMACQIYSRFPAHVVYIEDKASGTSLIQELKRETTMPIRAIKVDTDKLARAYAVTPIFDAGMVYVPRNENWVGDYIDEMTAFPTRDADDFVDSTSQCLSRMNHFRRSLLENQPRIIRPYGHDVMWSV